MKNQHSRTRLGTLDAVEKLYYLSYTSILRDEHIV